MEMLSYNFEALRNLHDCANDLLRSQVIQQALVHHRQDKWVAEISEASLRMLDVCGITRDVLFLVKRHLQDLQSCVRRRSIGESTGTKIGAYGSSLNKVMKKMVRCLEALKGMESDHHHDTSSYISDVDDNLRVVVTVVREVRIATISVVESILSVVSISKPKQRLRKGFLLNCIRGKRVASASDENSGTALVGINTVLAVLNEHKSCASKYLEALELTIESLEVESECMFRRLIQTRVSLLNILNN